MEGHTDIVLPELEDHIKRINAKLQQLLKQYQQLRRDNERQSKLIAELQQLKENNAEQIDTLQQQVTILKSAAGNMNATDKAAFEKLISQHIREIDKCIALLSE